MKQNLRGVRGRFKELKFSEKSQVFFNDVVFSSSCPCIANKKNYINANFNAQAVKRSFALIVPQIYLKF